MKHISLGIQCKEYDCFSAAYRAAMRVQIYVAMHRVDLAKSVVIELTLISIPFLPLFPFHSQEGGEGDAGEGR